MLNYFWGSATNFVGLAQRIKAQESLKTDLLGFLLFMAINSFLPYQLSYRKTILKFLFVIFCNLVLFSLIFLLFEFKSYFLLQAPRDDSIIFILPVSLLILSFPASRGSISLWIIYLLDLEITDLNSSSAHSLECLSRTICLAFSSVIF